MQEVKRKFEQQQTSSERNTYQLTTLNVEMRFKIINETASSFCLQMFFQEFLAWNSYEGHDFIVIYF